MKAQIKQYIRHAYKGLGDRVMDAEIKHSTGSEFNDSTGMMEETFTNYPVKILSDDFDKFEWFNGIISPGDIKILLPAEQIDFVPHPSDDSLIIEGETYSIETVTDKSGILYILKI
jgi:hypothetical protein